MTRCSALLAGALLAFALAQAAPATPPEVEQLQLLFKDFQPPLDVSSAGGKVIVTGRITSEPARMEFKQAMDRFPDVIDMVSVEVPEPLVGVNALFVEVEKSNGHDVSVLSDLQWLDAGAILEGSKELTPPEIMPGNAHLAWSVRASEGLLKSLQVMISRGTARVVARPRVVVQSGEHAALLSGGEVPYLSSNWQGTNTEFKPYGIRLDVAPEVLPSGDVMMDLVVESSEPGPDKSSGITARRATTRVTVGNGKSLLVAGLSSTSLRTGGGYGCFFPLFTSSRAYKKSELLVIVTPQVPPGTGLEDFDMIQRKDLGK